MPRASAFRGSALARLADQQRYTPARTVLAQIARLASFAAEIDAEALYDESEVVRAVTGFAAELDEPALIPGDALLEDLSVLAERLSVSARVDAQDLARAGIATVGVEALAARWDVARRTVERYRRRGLVGLRVEGRLVFAEQAVSLFEQRERERVQRAGAFERRPESDRDTVLGQAAPMLEQGFSPARLSRELAAAHGRSPEGVRQLVLGAIRRGELPAPTPRGPLSGRERRLIERSLSFGIARSRIADRLGVSSATVHRVDAERRLATLRRVLSSRELRIGEAGMASGEDPAVAQHLCAWPDPLPTRWAEFLTLATTLDPMPASVERSLALARQLLLDRASSGVRACPRTTPPMAVLDRAETDARWAMMLTWTLMRAALPLAARTLADRLHEPVDHLGRLEPDRSAAVLDLIRRCLASGLDRHDPRRGGRTAGPIGLELTHALTRGDQPRDPLAPLALALFPPAAVLAGLNGLPGDDRRIVERRFGLDGERPLNRDELRERFGVHPRGLAGILARLRRAANTSR